MQHLNLAKRLNFMTTINLYFLASMFASITFWMVCQAPTASEGNLALGWSSVVLRGGNISQILQL